MAEAMLNTTCQFEDPSYIVVLHFIFTTFSIPIYGFAFWVLTFKCPPRFKAYRNLIVLQIFSGIVLEFHVGVIWKVSLPPPWATVCSHGLASEYAVNCFQVFVALLVFNGITCLFLFFYRMENASKHTERSKLHMTTNFLKYLFYFMLLPTAVLTILVYPELDDQKEYKVKMERVYFLLKSDSMHSLVVLSGIWGTPFIYVV
ncbi:hypothetical protein GCK72_019563 [Caenorhabditis remanei]|uniref:Uncharacterized protein n=1 Tax=Caenorhabditis remanei TaxID=31234 RepID=A0A6A5GCY7_CAERE|nr:hypothetical protein GCK72_019563 [Caenorhabditis remanei]KAF1753008.1 hypothetical protein GCK72_019563 [Caenorhabditis remanei]